MTGLMLGPYLALDNIAVAAALAPFCRDRRQMLILIGWFAGVEATAPLLGLLLQGALPRSEAIEALRPAMTPLCGVIGMARIASWRRSSGAITIGSGGIAVLAMVLGLDNLAAGAALTWQTAIIAGVTSGVAVAGAALLAWLVLYRTSAVQRALGGGALLIVAGAGGLV